MNRTYIQEVPKEIGNTIKVQGFIENLRNSKAMAFIVLKDITGKLQITVEKADHPELVDTIDKLTPDSVITVTGKVVENDYVKMGGIEMIPSEIEIESIADALPIVRKEIAATKKKKAVERSSIDQRIDYRWIDLRTDENQLMFKAQSCFVNAMRKFLLDRSFIEIHTPKLIAAASESGSEVFKVDYFDRNAYLAQSPQFYKQMAMAAGFERIFETGPVFRAEKSYTNKHSTEFSGFDLEFSYITSYRDVMKMEEELLTAGLKAVKEAYGDQIKELFGQEVIVPETPFPVVKLADLYKGLEEEFGYTVDESEKGDLTKMCIRDSHTAEAAKALGMHVIAYDRYPSQAAKDLGVEFVELDDLFARSDVLGLQMPLMDFNTGIINKENIAKMKDGVIIINNSRGQMVVEQDLADALNSGKVACAGLDVVSTEPIRADNPLLKAKNCIITPHMSWGSRSSRQRIMDCTVENVRAFLAGQPQNVVNK